MNERDGVGNEPHLGSGLGAQAGLTGVGADLACWRCGYSRVGLAAQDMPCPECGSPAVRPHDADPEASVWEEPTTSATLAGAVPEDALTYARWLDARVAERDVGRSWALTGLIALCAGPFAVMGAFWGSGQTLLSVTALVVFGPMVEEVTKLALPTFVVERRPHLFLGRTQILICGACGGLVFSAIENLLYLHVYVPNPTPTLVAWRWTVCVALHVGCSTIGAIGLASVWSVGMRERRRPDVGRAARWVVLATIVHGTYNGLAFVLAGTGFGP